MTDDPPIITLTIGKLIIKAESLDWIDHQSFSIIDGATGKKYIIEGVDRVEMIRQYTAQSADQNKDVIGVETACWTFEPEVNDDEPIN